MRMYCIGKKHMVCTEGNNTQHVTFIEREPCDIYRATVHNKECRDKETVAVQAKPRCK